MARVPRALARKLDRLARRAHRFHRFAHHPLCAAYTGELLQIGRRSRVCRGCALLGAGAVSGLLAGVLLPLGREGNTRLVCAVVLALSLASAAFALFDLVPRARTAQVPRRGKLLTRGLPGFALLFACAAGVRAGGIAGSALVLVHVAAALLAVGYYRRRGPNRSPCVSCPERTATAPCSGFAAIVQRERAFARVARRMLAPMG